MDPRYGPPSSQEDGITMKALQLLNPDAFNASVLSDLSEEGVDEMLAKLTAPIRNRLDTWRGTKRICLGSVLVA